MAMHDSLWKQTAKLLKLWVHKISRKNLSFNTSIHTCSRHFIGSKACKLHPDEYPTLYFADAANASSQLQKKKSPKKKFDCYPANDDQYKCSGPFNDNEKCSERYHFVNTKDASTLMAAVNE